MRDKTAILGRLQHARDRGERFKTFLDDPDVAAFFTAYERVEIDAMLKASPTDDETRRAHALAINSMRAFRAFLSAAVVSGETAGDTLKRDTHGR